MKNKQSQNKKENLYITYYIDALASERSATQNTLESYRSDLHQFEEFLLESGTTLVGVNKTNIKDYVKSLCTQKKYKSSSISRKISAMKNFYKCLFNDGIIDFNPAPANDAELKNPKVSRPLPKYLSVEEIFLLMDTVRKSASESNKEISSKRLCAILDILYSSGMRVSELISMKLCEVSHLINSNNKECYIIIKGKSGRERQILFNEQALQSLRNYLSVRDNNFVSEIRYSDAFILEDVQNIKDEAMLLHCYNYMKESDKRLLITSSISPKKLNFKLRDLSSRILSTISVKILPASEELLRIMLIKRFSDKQLKIDLKAINYILARIERSFYSIDKIIEKIDNESIGSNVTVPFISTLLKKDAI